MRKCEECQKPCPKAGMVRQIAEGRMYATKELISLLKKIECGELVEVVHGRWIHKSAWHVECSECKHILAHIGEAKNYCPHCGAKMDGERREGE